MTLWPDESAVRRLELHEARTHAMRRGRAVRELPDGVLLHDELDPDPFWNRIASVRLPDEPGDFEERLDDLIVLFSTMNRRPHVWASPHYQRPDDLERRLERNGFVDLGRGFLMALADADAARAAAAADPGAGISVERLAGDLGGRTESVVAEIALVSAEAFGVERTAEPAIADDVAGLLGRPGFSAYLVRVDGEPAALAKATTFDGATYLSTIGTRPAFRGRRLATLATARASIDGHAAGSDWVYLGVFEANLAARRVYERLGFDYVGEAAGDWIL